MPKHYYLYPILTPNNIIQKVLQLHCPVCKGELDQNIQTDSIDGILCSNTSCLDIDDHYSISYEYKDPKKPLIITETIEIIEENRHYRIIFTRDNFKKKVSTSISVEDFITYELVEFKFPNEKVFNFNRFSRKKWLKEIKTMILLG